MKCLPRLNWLCLTVLCFLHWLCGQASDPEDTSSIRWEGDIRAFEKEDEDQPPAPGGVLFVGSSSIRLWDLKKSFPDLAALNRGFGGSQVADVVHFADRIVLKHRPRLIVLYSGDNDIASGKTPDQVAKDFGRLLEIIEKELPDANFIWLPIKPSIARWELWPKMEQTNAEMKKLLAAREEWHYAETTVAMLGADGRPRKELFVEDGLHLNERGYALWTEIVKELFDEVESAARR